MQGAWERRCEGCNVMQCDTSANVAVTEKGEVIKVEDSKCALMLDGEGDSQTEDQTM